MHAQATLAAPGREPQDAGPAKPVDVVRAVYAAYARRDLGAILRLYHPDCELYQTEALPWGGRYRGHLDLQRFFERLTSHLDTAIEDERLIEAGECVVSVGRTCGRALTTGQAIDLPAVHVYTVIGGLIHRCEAYVDTPAMAQAVGWRG